VPQVVDPKAATLEHLDLVIEPFHKAAVLVVPEIVGDPIQPRIEQFEEGCEAGESTGLHLAAPRGDAPDTGRFGAGGVEDRGQFLPEVIGRFQVWTVGQQPIQAVTFVGFQIGGALAKGPQGVFARIGIRLRQGFPYPLQFLRAKAVHRITIVHGHMKAVDHDRRVGQDVRHGGHIRRPHIGTDRANLALHRGSGCWQARYAPSR